MSTAQILRNNYLQMKSCCPYSRLWLYFTICRNSKVIQEKQYGPAGGIRVRGDVPVPGIWPPAGGRKLAGTAPQKESGREGTYQYLEYGPRQGVGS